MNDRKMLELAALAAGYKFNWYTVHGPMIFLCEGGKSCHQPWNPLENDTDALRLAAKLKFLIDTSYNGGVAVGSAELSCDDFIEYGDTLPSIRRAIVRAAAEIGQRMAHGIRLAIA